MTPRDVGLLRIDADGVSDPYLDWSAVYRAEVHAEVSPWVRQELTHIRHAAWLALSELQHYLATGELRTDPRRDYRHGRGFTPPYRRRTRARA